MAIIAERFTPDTYLAVAHGGVVDPMNPHPDKIKIETIAHALAHQCRYGGHVSETYTVAEHSVRCSFYKPEEQAFEKLMHDASEAYLVDVPSPLKRALFGERYREVEDNLMTVIAEKFNFEWPMTPEVEEADLVLLRTEVRDLVEDITGVDGKSVYWGPWYHDTKPLPGRIEPWPPAMAKDTFLRRFNYLKEKRGR